jgi:hypothetical protein
MELLLFGILIGLTANRFLPPPRPPTYRDEEPPPRRRLE